jgi:hypothetical protein
MGRWLLSPKRRIGVILGIGIGLNVLIQSVSSSRIGDLVGSLVGLGCLLAVARIIGLGPLRKNRHPVSPEVVPVSSPERDSPVDQLIRLGELRKSGGLSQDEFEAEKKRILDLPPYGAS